MLRLLSDAVIVSDPPNVTGLLTWLLYVLIIIALIVFVVWVIRRFI